MLTYDALNAKADAYIKFLSKAATADSAYLEKKIPKLFAENCQKIGEVGVISRGAFKECILESKKNLTSWHVTKLGSYPCEEHSVVSIKYLAETPIIAYLVTSIIKVNPEGLIEEVTETDTGLNQDIVALLQGREV